MTVNLHWRYRQTTDENHVLQCRTESHLWWEAARCPSHNCKLSLGVRHSSVKHVPVKNTVWILPHAGRLCIQGVFLYLATVPFRKEAKKNQSDSRECAVLGKWRASHAMIQANSERRHLSWSHLATTSHLPLLPFALSLPTCYVAPKINEMVCLL